MNARKYCSLTLVLAVLLQEGCVISRGTPQDGPGSATAAHEEFADPVLLHRQILLFGNIDEPVAKRTIRELLFLDGQSHEPIDLYLMTPGGDLKGAFAIEETMRLIRSPVNTYALAECNSGGAMLLAGGTGKRRAFRGAMVIVHGIKVHGRPPAGVVDQIQDGYTRFWRARTRLPESWLPIPPGTLHVLSADQSLQYGIVDEILEQ
jgi:ATP-dependent protease ClpP protease subunit